MSEFVVKNKDLAPNACGDCTACCTVMGVVPLGKPPDLDCEFLIPQNRTSLSILVPERRCGCSVYETRPEPCRTFQCLWLMGCFGDARDFRPDGLGLMFDLQPDSFVIPKTVTAREVWDGAADAVPGKSFLESLARKCLVLIMHLDGRRRLVGPPRQVQNAAGKMAGRQGGFEWGNTD